MQTIGHGYKALSLLFVINWDRLLFLTAILVGLISAAYFGSLGLF